MLIIEDEEYLRELYQELFQAKGYTADIFENGLEGLNALEKTSYDVVLLDIILPDIHGLDILAKIKQNDKTKQIPVILLTNLDQDIMVRKGIALGADGYLVKVSYTPEEIVQKVEEILQKYHTQKKNNS